MKLNHTVLVCILLLSATGSFAGAKNDQNSDDNNQLVVLNWSEYKNPELVEKYKKNMVLISPRSGRHDQSFA